MKSLTIIGRRWFQKGPGNTYHSARILIDGAPAGCTGVHYGYGDSYIETAFAQLESAGKIPPRLRFPADHPHQAGAVSEATWQWAERLSIALHCEAIDVRREKDL